MRSSPPSPALAPLVGGILVGGSSRRMGSPKAMLEWQGETFLERIARALGSVVQEIYLLGSGGPLPPGATHLPVLADAAGACGPLAGLLAAAAARSDAAWLVLSCDQPMLSRAALEWLVGERRHDRIAVLPRLAADRIEPFPGIYEPACGAQLAALAAAAARPGGGASLQPLAGVAGVAVAPVPAGFAADFRGVNTPAEWADLRHLSGSAAKDPAGSG